MNQAANHSQKTNLVNKQFNQQIKEYTEDSTAHLSPIIPELLDWLQKQTPPSEPFKICEFGGGGGLILKLIKDRSNHKLELHNAELVNKYKNHQASESIKFTETSVLNSDFPDNYFDAVLIRNVLHHLIGDSPKQTRINQDKAIKEMTRVTKPGKLILIEEQTNQSKLSCSIIFYLSKLACKLKLNIKNFQITPHTLVAYLTHKQLLKIITDNQKISTQKNKYYRWKDLSLKWKLILLLHNTGTSLFKLNKKHV